MMETSSDGDSIIPKRRSSGIQPTVCEFVRVFRFRTILSHSKTECETECEFTCYAPTGLSLSNDSFDSFAFEDRV